MNLATPNLQLAQDNQLSHTTVQNDLVSVIIPNYNHAQYVGEAIQSVLDQTYRNFEIIVVDDGSTDNSREVVAKFGNQVHYIWQENQGLSAARNTGIRAAQGEFIGLLDADDLYEPDFINTLVSALKANPEADAVYCAAQFVDLMNNPLPQQTRQMVLPAQLYNTLLNGGFFPPLCFFAHKYCYEQTGLFDKSFQGCADWDMWLRISGRFTVISANQILARYRVVPQSMSSDPIYMLNERLAVLKKHFSKEPTDISLLTATQRQAYGRSYLLATVEYLQAHNLEKAYAHLSEMLTLCPELLAEFDVFYEFGCGDQPRGFRGHFDSLNLPYNAQVLMDILSRLFNDPKLTTQLKSYRRLAYANAYFALGALSYGTGQFAKARELLFHAAVTRPQFAANRLLITTFIKSMLGNKLLNHLKNRGQVVVS
jgi:glycosyltransferase involved in cell wall biosynthesis